MNDSRQRPRQSVLLLLGPVYAAGLAAKDALRAAGILKTRRLGWPVVSIGGISAGGAGKTPAVISLARLMRRHGWAVDVLSRGYGRSGSGVELTQPDADDAGARYGDEPVLIARRAEVPVWVGAQRYAAGQLAELSAPGERHGLHLLDDGFQHRQLVRTVDIVLVTEKDLHDRSLPGGTLREPLEAIGRAQVVAVREGELASLEQEVRWRMNSDASLWVLRRELHFPQGLNAVMRPLAFCGIARPESFWQMLDDAGCAPAGLRAFADHHRYSETDMRVLTRQAVECGATGFITTEKDAVKLTPRLRAMLEKVGPINVATLEVRFKDEDEVVNDLKERLA